MQIVESGRPITSLVRFVFDDAVVSFSSSTAVTFEDIAETMGDLAGKHYGNPVATDLVLERFEVGPAGRLM